MDLLSTNLPALRPRSGDLSVSALPTAPVVGDSRSRSRARRGVATVLNRLADRVAPR